MLEQEVKRSKVEFIKEESVGLRGKILTELTDTSTGEVSGETERLLKFHGTYHQDDRDLRKERKKQGLEIAYSFMVRNRIPGGKITAGQFLGELQIADELGNQTLRLTTRQSIQLHGVVKENLWPTINRINQIHLSTQSACGDVARNVCCCPAPIRFDSRRDQLQAWADKIADHVRPKTNAYREIWIEDLESGERQKLVENRIEAEDEPLYGKTYMPRKFKIGIALPEDNCIDVYSHDLGLLAVFKGDVLLGFNISVGGGMGTTPSNKKCFPALGKRLTFAKPEETLAVISAIMMVERDFGDRADRKQARLKYLVNSWGIEAIKAKVEEYLPQAEALCDLPNAAVTCPLPAPHPAEVTGHDDHMGWHSQGDGKWFLGLPIENGRVHDSGELRLKSALRALFHGLVPNARLTMQQNILLCDIEEANKSEINRILAEHGVATVEQMSATRRHAYACPALPTCGLAVTESERVLPALIDEIERDVAEFGLATEQFTIRMTGCPNGCARPYNADIGLVGRSVDGKTGEGKYTIFLGGNLISTRLGIIYKDLVPLSNVASELKPAFECFKLHRQDGESLGDFMARFGVEAIQAFAAARAAELPAMTDD
ncbi:MAG: NADPH-dependent assimilatory sulfite reductase hemoprotein subunit [Planctomycetaceae bacterium]|jgi:sulfite reductase (ferredoxin)|nr:NADPH-dependent assimilatory sulfite reductase hemoprotein subunit [Planctomycetaceae bacterium]